MKLGNYWPYNLDKKAEPNNVPVYLRPEEIKKTQEPYVPPVSPGSKVESVRDHAPKIPTLSPSQPVEDDLDWAEDWDDEKDNID